MMASFHVSMCLEHLLKGYRVRQASARDLPCYSVLGDALIRQIIERRPRDTQELAGIRGMSKQRCEWYGEDILRMVRQAPLAAACMREGSRTGTGTVRLRHSEGGGRRLTKPAMPVGAGVKRQQLKARGPPYTRAPGPSRPVLPVGVTSQADGPEDDVYILELANGRVYVGKSGKVDRRVGQV